MIEKRYLNQLRKIFVQKFSREKIKVFIYGSSLERKSFRDIDIGILGNISAKNLGNELPTGFYTNKIPVIL